MNYQLRISGIEKRLELLWARVESLFRDREANEGPKRSEKLQAFRDMAYAHYPYLTVELWMNEYGLVNRVVNRASHKKFNPDGSWTSNGVKFGP